MRLFIILFLLLLFILFVPIKLKAKVNYDILNNYGFVSIYFYKLKVFLCKISFVPFKILIETKRKRFKFKIFKKEKDYSYGEIFFKEVMKRLRINNLRLTSRFGLFQDCLLSSIGSGSILALSSILMSSGASEFFGNCSNLFNTKAIPMPVALFVIAKIIATIKIIIKNSHSASCIAYGIAYE